MFCHARRQGPPAMCHGMSCSACQYQRPRFGAHVFFPSCLFPSCPDLLHCCPVQPLGEAGRCSWRCAAPPVRCFPVSPERPLRHGFLSMAAGIPSGFPGFASSAWACPFDPSPFVLPAIRLPERRDPLPRVSRARLCRRGRAYRAGAARAPDCARESQGAPLPCVSQGFFAPARTAKRSGLANAASFLHPNLAENFHMSISLSEILPKFYEQNCFKRSRRAPAPACLRRRDGNESGRDRWSQSLRRESVPRAPGPSPARAGGRGRKIRSR